MIRPAITTGSSPYGLASFDSASAMLRALAAFLHGRDFPFLGLPGTARPVATLAGRLPAGWRERVFARAGAAEAVPPRHIDRVDADAIARWMAGQYPRRRYPAVAVGSSSGALVHLCAALAIPWLPQTFLIPVRQHGLDPDQPRQALAVGVEPGRRLLARNPDLQLHHMQDPSQDRLMARHIGYFRVKRRRLGAAYERFLADHLAPGGVIIVVDCTRTWPTRQIGDRHVFQHGALGGATEAEFTTGGPRVAEFLARYGSDRRRWDVPEPDRRSPEAEWGFEPALAEDVADFAHRHGFKVARISFAEPDDLSPPVADLYRTWFATRRLPANRLLAESFIVLDPYWALRTGSVPYWMKFNMQPSAAALRRYLDSRAPFDEINLMLFAHGIDGIGFATAEEWRDLLGRARRRGRFLGTDPAAWPRNFATFVDYNPALRRLPSRYPLPGPLMLRQLARFVAQTGDRHAVDWQGLG